MSSTELKILVIEDNYADFLLLRENMLLARYSAANIFTAETLETGIIELEQHKPDLVFLDLHLPDSVGLDTFIRLKQYVTSSAVIVLSGLSDTSIALEAITQGAQDYLAKGEFDYKLLDKTIRYSIERKRSQLQSQRAITEATIRGQEKEREQLGVELHDNINQILATSRLYLDHALSMKPVREDLVSKGRQFISDAIEEIRSLTKKLLPPTLEDLGLIPTLNELIETISITGLFQIETKWEGFDERILQKDQKLTIYRILQELMNNIIKHAGAKHVIVSLRLIEETDNKIVELMVKDDGKGFSPTQKRTGVGLRNIVSRAELFGGTVNILSEPGNGCEMKVLFPGDYCD
jgi:signal transduction histidine kinase